MGSTSGLTAVNSRATGRTTRSQAMVSTTGRTVEYTKGTGTLTTCTGMDCTNGLTVECTKATISTIKKKGMASIPTQTVGAIRGSVKFSFRSSERNSASRTQVLMTQTALEMDWI